MQGSSQGKGDAWAADQAHRIGDMPSPAEFLFLGASVDVPVLLSCARHRLLPPARAPKLPFSIEDLTFFLDISYHGSPVFSHVFRYGGGSAVVPYSPDCYVDSGVRTSAWIMYGYHYVLLYVRLLLYCCIERGARGAPLPRLLRGLRY